MLKWLLVLFFCNLISSDTIVWDNYLDYCFTKVPPDVRPKARCEEVPFITVERHFLNDSYFWCVCINNTANIYKELVVEMKEPHIFNDTQMNINYLRTLPLYTENHQYNKKTVVGIPKGLKFAYELTPNYFSAGFRLQKADIKDFQIDRIESLRIDGVESCNVSRRDEPDELFPITEPLANQNRFLKHCVELNIQRESPEPGFCENVDEVIVRRLILNREIPFWCVTVDPKMKTDILIAMDGSNNEIEYNSGSDDKIIVSQFGKYFISSTHRTVIAIKPKNLLLPVYNITSLLINGLESCGIVLEQSMCGEPQFTIRSLITNGELTRPGQYPWHAAILEKQKRKSAKYLCGGTIIGKNVVLTAGHCVSNIAGITPADTLLVKVGLNDLRKRTEHSQVLQIAKVVLHEDFDINYLEHDIAILKLNKFLEYNNFVQPICLAQNSGPYNHVMGVVPGWGRNENQQKQNLLSAATLPIIDSKNCRRSNRNFFQQFLNDGKFCAGYRNGTSICTGDSGGGFAVKFPRRWYLRGIVSLGVSERGFCALEEYVLFTDVVHYYKWIKSKLIL